MSAFFFRVMTIRTLNKCITATISTSKIDSNVKFSS